jgi:hypothetical protein
VTTPTIETIEIEGRTFSASEETTLTQPRPAEEIAERIQMVVSDSRYKADEAFDVVTVLQIKARIAADSGERLSFEEFADEVGFDLPESR